MSKRMYTRGTPIRSLAEFERYKGNWFIVRFGDKDKTINRGFVESWQIHMFKSFLYSGRVFEARRIEA